MYWHIEMGSGPRLRPIAPGCVISPNAPRSFGFARALVALIATISLVWGSLAGHAVECIAAAIAAVLVDAVVGGILHARKAV
ncbi:hypothetical protein ACFW2D_17685 [Streptomyces sp. NPDC058914]|uniref:hypothetical protein n=1 Tax=Streptomyces sp. NPDC058914 TaxID=3346671 RepID=UPI0036C332BD